LSVSYPLKRHAFQRVGVTYSLNKSTITGSAPPRRHFSRPSASVPAFRVQCARGIVSSSPRSPISTTPSTTRCAAHRQGVHRVFQWRHRRQLRYFTPMVAYKRFMPIHYLMLSPTGATCWSARAVGLCTGLWRDVARQQPLLLRGEASCAASTFAGNPVRLCSNRINFQLTNPTEVACARPNNPQLNQCIQVPLPVYGIASIGGIPVSRPIWSTAFHRRSGHLRFLRRLRHRRGLNKGS